MSDGEFVPPLQILIINVFGIVDEYIGLAIQEGNTIGQIQQIRDDNRKLEQCISQKRKFDDDKIALKNAIRRYDEKCSTGTQ
jgi:hypothetical protein